MLKPLSVPADRPRRFYKQVGVAARDGGFAVLLDARQTRTPAGAALVVPTETLAHLLAQEWEAQVESVDLSAMPANRLAATVIDRTAGASEALAMEVARYAGSDVLCYLADGPQALVQAQSERWGPWLEWARGELGVDLQPATGVMHRPQPPQALARVQALVDTLEPFAQAATAFAAPLFGSAVLALAVQRGALEAQAAFELSRLEEAFQEARWGVDDEAALRTGRLREEARLLGRWFAALDAH